MEKNIQLQINKIYIEYPDLKRKVEKVHVVIPKKELSDFRKMVKAGHSESVIVYFEYEEY